MYTSECYRQGLTRKYILWGSCNSVKSLTSQSSSSATVSSASSLLSITKGFFSTWAITWLGDMISSLCAWNCPSSHAEVTIVVSLITFWSFEWDKIWPSLVKEMNMYTMSNHGWIEKDQLLCFFQDQTHGSGPHYYFLSPAKSLNRYKLPAKNSQRSRIIINSQ